MNKLLLGITFATTLSTAAFATSTTTPPAATATPPVATTKAYIPGKTPGSDFESLTKAEKIKLIEQKHAEAKARADAKWKAMSDDDKIAKYEHRRQAFMARRNGTAAPATTATTAPVAAPPATSVPVKK